MNADILIIGAGASGLMAARDLSKAGKKVVILEARDRIGGRIFPLDESEFGYPAQGGAEFVHGNAPVTKAIAAEAGMTLALTEGDMWSSRSGEIMLDGEVVPEQTVLHEKLKELDKDIPLADFFDLHFRDKKYDTLRNDVFRMVEGYDAADPKKISTFALRDEWLNGEDWLQYRIKEGYGKLLRFLESEIKRHGGEIILKKQVVEIKSDGKVRARTSSGDSYEADQVIVTVPLRVLSTIAFDPPITEKLRAADDFGFGGVIKVHLKFKDRWWVKALKRDFSEMDFMLAQDTFSAWWTQYPDPVPVLVGWLAGPKSEKFAKSGSDEIVDEAISSLSDLFKVEKTFLNENLLGSTVTNWLTDPHARAAYSYDTPKTGAARRILKEPIGDKIFFAGEALYGGKETATVEGALASGLEAAKRILQLY